MKIGIVAEWLDISRGGAETSIRQFLDALLERGMSLEVLTRSPLPSRGNLRVRTITPKNLTRRGATACFMREAESAVKAGPFDVVHAFTPCAGADIYQPRGGTVPETIRRTVASRPTPAARLTKRWTLGLNGRQRMLLAKERAWLTGPDRPIVIAISDYVARQLVEHYDFPASHIRHVFNGVQAKPGDRDQRIEDRLALRKRFGIDAGDYLLLQVAHNFRLKGVHCSIEALALSVKSGLDRVSVLVVGRDDPGPFRRLAERLGISASVHFSGPMDRVAACYHAADVLIHPTYYDPCSRVVLEAVTFGLPVIGTSFDGATDVLEDGVSGFIVDSPDSIEKLAQRIRTLSTSRERTRMADQAARIADRITMSRHADEVTVVYKSLVKRVAG